LSQPGPNLLTSGSSTSSSLRSGASAMQTNTITDLLQQLFGLSSST
jgi:hypothetical protein